MSSNMEQVVLQQMDGQKNKQHCPNCNKETIYIYHKSGIANCTECGIDAKIDLVDVIKQLKEMGAFVS